MIAFFQKLSWLARRRDKEDRQTAGLSAQDARWAWLRELGNVSLVQEDTRSTWRWRLLEQLGHPRFTILTTLSLALRIGANTAIYSLMQAVLLRPLPVADPGSLVI